MTKKIALIGLPLYQGCDNKGVDKAPQYLVPFLKEKLKPMLNCVKQIDALKTSQDDGVSPIKYRDDVLALCTTLAKEVDLAMSQSLFPFVVGGDHTLGMSTIAGVSKHVGRENLSVIWFDAHSDINIEKGSPSRNAHGMPLAATLGLMADEAYNNLLFDGPKIDEQHLHYFGARSIDPMEASVIKDKSIHLMSSHMIKLLGIKEAVKQMIASIDTQYVHLSFDLDVLDPLIFGATGVKEKDGLTMEDVSYALACFFKELPIVSFDFVEYHPQLDTNQDIKKVEQLLTTIADTIKGLN